MSDHSAATPMPSTFADFEATFGLEPNVGTSNAVGETGDTALDAAADEALGAEADLNDAVDNNDLAARRAARRAPPSPLDGLEANGETDDVDEEDEGAEAEEEEPGAPPAEGGELTAERAQAVLDTLLERFGDQLQVQFRANGEERRATLREMRDTYAPGYMGQEGVHRTFEQAREIETRGRQEMEQAQATIAAAQETMQSYATTSPERFVEDYVVRLGGVDAVRRLHQHTENMLAEYDADPTGFTYRRETRDEIGRLTKLVTKLAEGGASAAGEKPAAPAEPKADAAGDIPGDYAFTPGKGYPMGAMAQAAFSALEKNVAVANRTLARLAPAGTNPPVVSVDEVVAAWQQQGRQVPIFAVLDSVVDVRAGDVQKATTSATPPRRVPQGAPSPSTPAGGRKARGGRTTQGRGFMAPLVPDSEILALVRPQK